MIPDLRELYYSIYGAWRLMRLDVDGLSYFNLTVAGFWRSFFAGVIILPMILIDFAPAEPDGPTALDEILQFAVGWFVFPLVMIPISQLLDRRAFYARFIIAAHWLTVLQSAAMTIVLALAQALPADFGAFLTLIAFAILFAYDVYVARLTLSIDPLQAFGVAVLGFLISLLLAGLFMLGSAPPDAVPA